MPESAGHARLALSRATVGLGEGALDTATEQAQLACEIARRLDGRELEVHGLHLRGRALLRRGEIEEGTALLDEAMAAAVAGQLGPFRAAGILCNTISACREVADYRRAAEWTEVADRAAVRQGLVVVPGHCRIERAGILRVRGQWAEAEGKARNACEELDSFERGYLGRGWSEIAEIRLGLGDLAGAAAALERVNELGGSPQPGLALLRLAEGRVDADASMIQRALAEDSLGPLARARMLPAPVEIVIAAGDLETARSAVEEQQAIAGTYRTPALEATAA